MRAVIALGANLDDPGAAVELAMALLEGSTNLIARSSLHTTKPVGGPPQSDFINAVCIVDSELPAHDLLSLLLGIEVSMGRTRNIKWGPRTIDCDLISYGDIQLSDETLTLPHPLAHLRRFVLEPWLEIDPDAELLGLGLVRDLLAQLPISE